MSNPSKQIGTAAESAVVRVARLEGYPNAERRALAGSADVGDVLLCPGLIAEVKAGKAAKEASVAQIEAWLAETERERINAKADVGLLVVQRKGIGIARAELWDCWLRLDQVVWSVSESARVDPLVAGSPTCLRLVDALMVLRLGGWGDPLPFPRQARPATWTDPVARTVAWEVGAPEGPQPRCHCGATGLPIYHAPVTDCVHGCGGDEVTA